MDSEPSLWSLMAYGDAGFGDEFLRGLLFTVQISVCGYIMAFVLGLLGAGAKLHGNKALYRVGDLYTTFIRALPELLLILMVYYMGGRVLTQLFVGIGLAGADFQVSPFAAAVASLGLIYGAYLTDIFRGAIQAIQKGQIEAARAYGMHAPMRFRRIIFPQMIRFAIPGMGNQWLNITKDSALVSAIGAFEMAFAAKSAAAQTKHYIFFLSIGGLCFLCITIVSMILLQHVERRTSRGVRRA
jgi:His/Glu/Gln/Arg/opine family amino acid ABC transporter permease subunit